MVKPSSRKRRRRTQSPFLGLAIAFIGVGLFLKMTSGILLNQTLFEDVGVGLSKPAWWAIVLGALLLGLHVLVMQSRKAPPHGASRHPRPARPTAAPAALKALIDDVERQEPLLQPPPPPTAAGPSATGSDAGRIEASRWSPAVFAAIEWRRFEAVCEMLFAQAGFETRMQSHGADGGVDIWLHSKNAQGPVAVAQCKHWQDRPVGVKELREFFGVMASHGLKRGTYASTSGYTHDAQAFAKDHGINALDGAGLLALINQRTPEQQAALLKVAYEGEYWRPTCANCGIKLVERQPAKGGASFWGCVNYPRCKSRIYRRSQA